MVKSERDYALQLLEMAGKDQRALANMRDTEAFSDEVFGFKQAVEKALKAWLSSMNRIHPRTHDISELVGELRDAGAEVGEFAKLQNYSAFAVEYRYAAYNPAEGPLDRVKAIEETAALIAHVRGILDKSKL